MLRSSRTMLPKNSSISRWNALRKLSSKSGNRLTTGSLACSERTLNHCPLKLLISAFGLRILQHSLHLLLEYRRILEFPLCSDVEQLVIGNAAPQEKRQP